MDGVAVHLVLPMLAGPPVHATTGRVGTHPAISLCPIAGRRVARAIRRCVDVLGALTLLVALAPVFLAVALIVRARMGAPIFYRQERVGSRGRSFRIYKFRSMLNGTAEQMLSSPEDHRAYVASSYKMAADDPRVPPVGKILRRSSLDELPQLWNVLRGDMSLVGPRPVVPAELEEYGEWKRLLLRAKPGLTGAWQVGGRGRVGYPERAHMELDYVSGGSLMDDLGILLRTVPAVIRRRGAS
jgi:lipopolysaccharide/colanic/teichoic acid biosynthesis glycosyltransferase